MEVFAGVAALVGPVAKVEALLTPHTFRRRRAVKDKKRLNFKMQPSFAIIIFDFKTVIYSSKICTLGSSTMQTR